MYSWPKMKNLKRSFHARVRKVKISPILIRGSLKRFEDSEPMYGKDEQMKLLWVSFPLIVIGGQRGQRLSKLYNNKSSAWI